MNDEVFFGTPPNPDLPAPEEIYVWGSVQTGHVWSARNVRHNNPVKYVREDVHIFLVNQWYEEAHEESYDDAYEKGYFDAIVETTRRNRGVHCK